VCMISICEKHVRAGRYLKNYRACKTSTSGQAIVDDGEAGEGYVDDQKVKL